MLFMKLLPNFNKYHYMLYILHPILILLYLFFFLFFLHNFYVIFIIYDFGQLILNDSSQRWLANFKQYLDKDGRLILDQSF